MFHIRRSCTFILLICFFVSFHSTRVDAGAIDICRSFLNRIAGIITLTKKTEKITQFNDSFSLPENETPIILIGLFGEGDYKSRQTDLDEEAKALTLQLKHPVITYLDIPKFNLHDPEKTFGHTNVVERLQFALKAAVARSPNRKIAIVRLDGINPKKIGEYDRWPGLFNATNSEIRMILRNPDLLTKTRWVLESRELSDEEVRAFLKPYTDNPLPW